MGYTKDMWTRPVERDGKTVREPNDRWGKGKRWLACWRDPDGKPTTEAFAKKNDADEHWKAQETDVARGQYVDRKAGQVPFDRMATKWLRSRGDIAPNTLTKYEASYRDHVKPWFGTKQIGNIRPSDVSEFLTDLRKRYSVSVARTALLVIGGTLELAVVDGKIPKNPARDDSVKRPTDIDEDAVIDVWDDQTVDRIIDAHWSRFRPIAEIAATTAMRQGEIFGLADDDIDYEKGVIHVRRQIKYLRGGVYVFAPPKGKKARRVPMLDGLAQVLQAHRAQNPPRPYTLPWIDPANDEARTVNLLFRWTDDRHIRATAYQRVVWLPALVDAGVIAPPTRHAKGGWVYDTDDAAVGMHQLRHYAITAMLSSGVNNAREVAEWVGHANPEYMARIYLHSRPDAMDRFRQAMNPVMFRLRSVGSVSDGAVTEQGRRRVSRRHQSG
jgi:integrase